MVVGAPAGPPPYPGTRPSAGVGGSKAPSLYGSLATDVLPPAANDGNTLPKMYSGGSRTHLIAEQANSNHYLERSQADTSTTGEVGGECLVVKTGFKARRFGFGSGCR